MKRLILLSACFCMFFLSYQCKGQIHDIKHLVCVDYWSQVKFSDFCGLSVSNFEFNTIPNDICNADQNGSYSFDDFVSIRVYNHFSNGMAQEEYNAEQADAESLNGYSRLTDVGDDAYAVVTTEFGKLDMAIVQVVIDTYTIYLEVNGKTHNSANNCFDESSVIKFAKALVDPLDTP